MSDSTSTELLPFEPIGPGLHRKTSLAPSLAVPIASIARLTKLATEVPAPVKAVARMSAKSGAAGAIVDAALGGYNALGPLARNEITIKQCGIHIVSEGACGFLTAGAGTAGSITAFMITGSLGPIVIASGMASSMAVRYGYRRVVGETLPPQSDNTPDKKDNSRTPSDFEDIGQKE